jgi:hypothetical protein
MTVTQPYQKRVGITLRRQTTMIDAMKKRKGPAPERHDFQARKAAKALRETVPVRQQAHWSRLQAEQKMRDAVQREALLGERRAMIGYRTDGRFAPHIESRLREIEGHL